MARTANSVRLKLNAFLVAGQILNQIGQRLVDERLKIAALRSGRGYGRWLESKILANWGHRSTSFKQLCTQHDTSRFRFIAPFTRAKIARQTHQWILRLARVPRAHPSRASRPACRAFLLSSSLQQPSRFKPLRPASPLESVFFNAQSNRDFRRGEFPIARSVSHSGKYVEERRRARPPGSCPITICACAEGVPGVHLQA